MMAAECKSLLTSHSLWIVDDTSGSNLALFLPNTLITNTGIPYRVRADGERHSDIKTAYRYGTQYISDVQKCLPDITNLYVVA
jgi:hypothetical protein